MPRPKQNRKISNPPLMQGFKPYGIPQNMLSSVSLLYDEYEAIRLLDYEGLNQDQAAARMNVSRPTLTRIYEQGRQFEMPADADVIAPFLKQNYPDTKFITGHCTGDIMYTRLSNQLGSQLDQFYAGFIRSID